MKNNFIKLIIFLLSSFPISFSNSQDLTRQKPINQTLLLEGKVGEKHFYNPQTLYFKTGKLYKLKIRNISDSKHYFTSNNFSKAIFTRKIQVNLNNTKIAEIKGIINEIEVWPRHEIEWWFVPIKTGKFEDLFCRVKDNSSGKEHRDMGMKGKIIID